MKYVYLVYCHQCDRVAGWSWVDKVFRNEEDAKAYVEFHKTLEPVEFEEAPDDYWIEKKEVM